MDGMPWAFSLAVVAFAFVWWVTSPPIPATKGMSKLIASVALVIAANVGVTWLTTPHPSPSADCRDPGEEDAHLRPAATCFAELTNSESYKLWKRWHDFKPMVGRDAQYQDLLESCAEFHEKATSYLDFCSNSVLTQVDLAWIDFGRGRPVIFRRVVIRGKEGGAHLNASYLANATFVGADLDNAELNYAVLHNAKFRTTKLRRINFGDADMRGVSLIDSDVSDARFSNANLDGAIWEPTPGGLPYIPSFTSAKNLSRLKYERSPQQLSELREAFYKAGMADEARQVTYAIERTRRIADEGSNDLLIRARSWFRFLAFEQPVAYGLHPFRPLLWIALLIPMFVPIYLLAISTERLGGLWIRSPDGAIEQSAPSGWLPMNQYLDRTVGQGPERLLSSCGFALWYSVICAFRIGYRDVNVGDWITRIQPQEYLLGATGVCRTLAGVQSLLSVYLLALTVLCIVGRPFG